jgi:hypothetical protein
MAGVAKALGGHGAAGQDPFRMIFGKGQGIQVRGHGAFLVGQEMPLTEDAERYEQEFDYEKHVLKIHQADFRLISSS